MKTFIITAFAVSIAISASAYNSPDSLGLPGDGLNLQATLNLFKESKSPEEFEKKLNHKDNHVNNLDINNDGKVDYIRVHDISKDNVHALVLQVPVNEKESQDVAVIEIEKRGSESAAIQIVGDEELYGEEYTVQPKPEKGNSGSDNKWNHFTDNQVVFVNVWYWPCVYYIYQPAYVIWISPYYWAYYPLWWDPWMPYPFYTYYGWTYVYYDYYYCCDAVYVLPNAPEVYAPRRVVSQTVQQNNRAAGNNRPGTKQNGRVNQSPQQEVPRDQSRPKPKPEPLPAPTQRKDDAQPQPAPPPAPRPQPRPDVHPAPPSPRPAPSPAPRPMPPPRSTPRPR